ncbi:MAG: SO2930 family diheme c-type cytochrome [Novosphingobium sp.]
MRLLALALALLSGAMAVSAMPPPPPEVRTDLILGSDFPQKLSDYGFFFEPNASTPNLGVKAYRLNTPLWSDGAEKLRFVYIPQGKQAKAQGEGLLDLPVGSALIKTFKFDGKLIETRVLLHRADGWVALPYVWDADQQEARLTLGGKRIELAGPGGKPISYAVPNKNQCKECHGVNGQVTPIGPKAYNLSVAWLTDLNEKGLLDQVPTVTHRIPLWEDRDHVPAADAARGYLEANCAHCHNPDGAASNSGLYLGWQQSDPIKLGVGKRPVAAGRGSGNLEFDVVPGDPAHSILYYRMASLEGGIAMPELGRSALDPAGLAAVQRWIGELKK